MLVTRKSLKVVILQFPGSIYAIETRNPGPIYANKFFQLVFCRYKRVRLFIYEVILLISFLVHIIRGGERAFNFKDEKTIQSNHHIIKFKVSSTKPNWWKVESPRDQSVVQGFDIIFLVIMEAYSGESTWISHIDTLCLKRQLTQSYQSRKILQLFILRGTINLVQVYVETKFQLSKR